MTVVLYCMVLMLLLALQLSLGSVPAILGVTPDLVFAAVASLAAQGTFLSGSFYGAGIGLMMDALFLSPGRYSIQYLLAGCIAGLLPVRGQKHRFAHLLAFCLPAYFAKETFQLLLLRLDGAMIPWPVVLGKVGIGAIYTGVISIAFYLIFEAFARKRKPHTGRWLSGGTHE